MAQIRRVTRSNPLSNFQQAAPSTGGAFRFLAGAAEEAYEFLKPAAIEEMTTLGGELGREIAKQQVGDPQGAFTVSRMGGGAAESPAGEIDWSKYAVGGAAARPDSFTRLDPTYRGSVAAMLQAADAELGPGSLKITSAYRSTEKQAELYEAAVKKYGSPEAARKWVAPPGRSKHESGTAVDFADASGSLLRDPNSREAKWIKENAGRFGLDVPMSWEPWQVEPAGSRGTSTTTSASNAPPTMIRDADGKLVARLFSPMAGEILQAHNAAAGVAYQSDVMLKAQTDLMDLSRQYALDPDSFAQAAQGYMSDLVKAAPAMFKEDIRGAVQQEVQRRFLGMVDEKHRDIRQRANNQSAALVDRWSDTLSQAIVGGNEEEIAAAEGQLNDLLRARESLPGLSWTPEQSQNVILKAQEAAQKEAQRRQAEQVKTWKGDLSLIRDAAKDGRRAADEGILGNPLVQQAMPDEWAEAAAFVMLRDELPSFNRMTPAEQRAALEEMRSADVQQDFELDLFAAAETAAKANAKAWEDDPIKRAAEVLPEPPPPIVNFDAQNPSEFVEALADRNAYGMKLVENGYVDVPAFLSKEEAETIGGLMGKETPPELRAVMAAAMVEGFGENAVQVFKEIKNDDPTTLYAGMLMARGGDKAVAFEAMRGQSLLDEGLVQAPSVSTSLEAISPEIAAALATVPINAQGELRKFAVSIYAARARGVMEASEQKTLMQDAVQAALGQSTNRRGQVTGGVQTLGGQPVLLPPGIAGERAEEALARAFTGRMPTISAGRIALGNVPLIGRMTLPDGQVDPDMWGEGGPPMLGGQPVDGKLFANGNVRLVPTSGTSYRIEVVTSGSVLDAHNAAGGIFEFDMQSLVDGVPVQPSIGNEPRTPRELGGR